jgi:hypothetical protein
LESSKVTKEQNFEQKQKIPQRLKENFTKERNFQEFSFSPQTNRT